MFGAGTVGLLVAAMAKISGAGTVVIADIDQGRVDFAVKNHFADRAFTVPMKRGNTIEEQLELAKETAAAIGKTPKGSAGEIGEVDATFECTDPDAAYLCRCASRGGYTRRVQIREHIPNWY